jgi:hypothetical protein
LVAVNTIVELRPTRAVENIIRLPKANNARKNAMRCGRQSTSQSELRTANHPTTNIRLTNRLANHYPSKNRKLAKLHLPHLIRHHLGKLQVSNSPLRVKTSTTIMRWPIFGETTPGR